MPHLVSRLGGCLLAAVVTAGLLTANAGALPSSWKIDPVHSSAEFTAVHLGISHVTGTIPIESAKVVVPDGSNVPSSAEATLDIKGIDTHNDSRDNDLRSPHFFDVTNDPTMTFTSTSITSTDGKTFTMQGNLTMHGQTHPVTFTGQFLGRGPGMREGQQRIAFAANATIDRTQWGMTYGYPVVSNSIDLTVEIEAVKQ